MVKAVQPRSPCSEHFESVLGVEGADRSGFSRVESPAGVRLRRVEGDIPASVRPKRGELFLFISRTQSSLTHGVHKYPAKFFPELPSWLIRQFSKEGEWVLDPFMGSGTTGVEAMVSGRNCVGVDVDPFSRLLSRVKTTPLELVEMRESYRVLREFLSRYDSSSEREVVPEFPYREHWFASHVLGELAFIRASVLRLECSAALRDFFLVIFSSLIRRVSRADDRCTRTVVRRGRPKFVAEGKALSLFMSRLQKHCRGMEDFVGRLRGGCRVLVPDGDSALDLWSIGDGSVGLAVTSPPYLNAVDYPRTHQLEMYWLGLLGDESLSALKRRHTGTEVVYAREYRELRRMGISLIDDVLEEIYRVDPRRSFIGFKYLCDMRENLQAVYRKLRRGGRYVVVVGNNRVRGVRFETWRYLEVMAEELGYEVENAFRSAIINHFISVPRLERIEEDQILIFRKK